MDMNLRFGREVTSNLNNAESREWLITNGIGGFASGTIGGLLTRRYHGLLIAALKPPVARTLLFSKLDETVNYNGQAYDLATNRWSDGTIAPQGYLNLESFHLEGTIPVWNFAFADGLLEKRIWMPQGENTTYIRYRYQRGSQPLTLSLKALVNDRSYHGDTHVTNNSLGKIEPINSKSLVIQVFPDTNSLYLSAIVSNQTNNFSWQINNTWYHNFALAVEKYRGLEAIEDHLLAATGKVSLQPEDTVTIIASTEKDNLKVQEANNEEQELIQLFYSQNKILTAPKWIQQLVLAANQFIVARPLTDNPQGKTIIAGYPWFTDWGRDTMISLPGLAIATGRYEIAKTILLTFAKYVDQGMLPNVFPDVGETPQYNTVDATLWYFEAIYQYYQATQEQEFIAKLFPLLAEIIDWHIKGTRYRIKVDDDGLLYAGEYGVQLTWMDAKVGDWVVTPRIGKPIEVNALWYNALVCMNYFADILGKSGTQYQEMMRKVQTNFAQFWYAEGSYCYDVIDTPDGNDSSFRPNQIFAVSLPNKSNSKPLLSPEQQKMIVDRLGEKLLTSYGLRSLATDDPHYVGIYGGDQLHRDGSYHQGTTWAWLIGHFTLAHWQVYNNPKLALSLIAPMADHLHNGCIGSISEIFDGDVPFIPRGCFAQAWSVAEVLRTWLLIQRH